VKSVQVLTIWQPYAWAIVEGFKPVENRTWKPPPGLIGRWLLIHAGKGAASHEETMSVEQLCGRPVPGTIARGAIVGCARLTGVVSVAGDVDDRTEHFRREQYLQSPWLTGPYGWVLEDPVAFLKPIHCGGRQKVWTAPPPIALQARRAYWEATKGTPWPSDKPDAPSPSAG